MLKHKFSTEVVATTLLQQKLLHQRNNFVEHLCCKFSTEAAQEWRNRTPITTNLSIPYFLVLPGRESTITEITEYIQFSLP